MPPNMFENIRAGFIGIQVVDRWTADGQLIRVSAGWQTAEEAVIDSTTQKEPELKELLEQMEKIKSKVEH